MITGITIIADIDAAGKEIVACCAEVEYFPSQTMISST